MISQHTYDLAEELGIKIAPSKEKINIFDYNGNFICSIGVKKDYCFYLKTKGLHETSYIQKLEILKQLRALTNKGTRNFKME